MEFVSNLIFFAKSLAISFVSAFGDHLLKCVQIFLESLAFVIALSQPSRPNAVPAITDSLLLEPASELVPKIKKGLVKSEDLVKAYINRIKSVDPIINAVIDQQFARAIDEAVEIDKKIRQELDGKLDGRESIRKLPLLGIPFTAKDSIAVKGMLHTAGVVTRKGTKAERDGLTVKLLRQAGAIPLALTNVPEYIVWFDSFNKLYGRTLNPYDLSRISGGSSSGEAALISSAGSLIGLGSDIAGSVRCPNMFCGIFGHNPTPKIVSMDGNFPDFGDEASSFANYGPMTRYASDLSLMLKVMAGDRLNKLKLDEAVKLAGVRIYYQFETNNPLTKPVDKQIKAAIWKAVEHLRQTHGCDCRQINDTKFRHSLLYWEYRAKAAKFPGFASLVFDEEKRAHLTWSIFSEFFKYFLRLSNHTFHVLFLLAFERLLPSVNSSFGQKILKMANELRNELMQLLGCDGVLLFPTFPEPAPKHWTTPLKVVNCEYMFVFSALGFPVTQCPLGFSNDGLPIGVQVVAAPYNDHLTIAVAQELEKRFGGWKPPNKVLC